MKTLKAVVVVVLLLVGIPASAQVAPPEQPGNIVLGMPENGCSQSGTIVTSKIAEIDLAGGTITLANGIQATLAPSLQFTSAPVLGQEVEVWYDTQTGGRVVRSIDQSMRGGNAD